MRFFFSLSIISLLFQLLTKNLMIICIYILMLTKWNKIIYRVEVILIKKPTLEFLANFWNLNFLNEMVD